MVNEPYTLALMSMRVVFWKDAAERNDARESDTSRMPMMSGSALAASPPFGDDLIVYFREVRLGDDIADRELGRPDSVMRTRLNICRMMTSRCLVDILAPCSS